MKNVNNCNNGILLEFYIWLPVSLLSPSRHLAIAYWTQEGENKSETEENGFGQFY